MSEIEEFPEGLPEPLVIPGDAGLGDEPAEPVAAPAPAPEPDGYKRPVLPVIH